MYYMNNLCKASQGDTKIVMGHIAFGLSKQTFISKK